VSWRGMSCGTRRASRVKLKGEAYLSFIGCCGVCRSARVRRPGGWDLRGGWRELPEEFRPEVEAMAARFSRGVGDRGAAALVRPARRGGPQDVRPVVQANVPRPLCGPVFQLPTARR
jgi:hypothetical protein